VEPLTAEQSTVFWSSPEDAVPHSRVDDRHYVHSNERKHYLFFPYMDCSGQGYVGVGSDQNLTMLARCRAGYAWIMDYDEVIVLLHTVHRILVVASPTPDGFVDRWREENAASTLALLEQEAADDPRLDDIKWVYRNHRENLLEHFLVRRQQTFKGQPVTWLSSEGDYTYVRGMYMAGRIRPMLGDLLAGKAVTGIAAVARSLGVSMRVVYLTNVEELVRWEPAFKESMRALPMDGSSMVLRTLSSIDDYPDADAKWHYNVQSGLDFQQRLGGKVKRIQALMPQRETTPFRGLSTLGLEKGAKAP